MRYSSRLRGFTLLEVMVALVIFALCAAVLVQQFGRSAKQGAYLEAKTLATWTAENVIAELRVNRDWKAIQPHQTRTMGGREWQVITEIKDTEQSTLKLVRVEVSLGSNSGHSSDLFQNGAPIAVLTTLISEH